jgi:hypothetical protein
VWFITERISNGGNRAYLREMEEQFWSRMVARAIMLTVFLLAGSGIQAAVLGATFRWPYLSGSFRRRALIVDAAVSLVVAVLVHLFA